MGEARNRLDRKAAGLPCKPPKVCPKCKSIAVGTKRFPPVGLSHVETDYDICRDCGTCWEAYPENWCEDVIGAEPCDNCAFRAGSPEQLDAAEWKLLISKLQNGGEFLCHKGIPIAIDPDAETDRVRFDFDAVPVERRRWCAGFARMVWAMREKGNDWLKAHHEVLTGERELAPGYDLPLPDEVQS